MSAAAPASAAAPPEAAVSSGDAEVIAALSARVAQLEAHNAVRAVMSDYLRICDHLDAAAAIDELRELFTQDALWTGKGGRYASAFGAHQGRDAILAMLGRYRDPPHFAFNAHFLTSEKIVVMGDSASGNWLMLQTSTYATGKSDLRSAALAVEFRLDGSHWRISRFETENLFSRAVDRWNDEAAIPVPGGAAR